MEQTLKVKLLYDFYNHEHLRRGGDPSETEMAKLIWEWGQIENARILSDEDAKDKYGIYLCGDEWRRIPKKVSEAGYARYGKIKTQIDNYFRVARLTIEHLELVSKKSIAPSKKKDRKKPVAPSKKKSIEIEGCQTK